MTHIVILYATVVSSPRASLAYRDFEKLVTAFGFRLARQRGRHRAYVHIRSDRLLVLQPRKDGNAKVYQVQQFLDIVEEVGLSIEERRRADITSTSSGPRSTSAGSPTCPT